jgi:aminobenzoyl-glutamate utilization protein B
LSKQNLLQWFEEHQASFSDMARKIWEHPEMSYEEKYASNLQMVELKEEGFTIETSIGGIQTAFMAEYGSGKPIIGILGEYDALPGLSQTVSPSRQEVIPNGPGHGCGHNLLGTAGVEAVVAIKKAIEQEGLIGTIRYYGCPAEELLSGKTFMARAGAFDDLDCVLTWHPGTANEITNSSLQAMTSIKFNFKGTTAHAGVAPHAGRSALDAVELMNVGSNYMREHVPDGSRIHYVITNGGLAPNIVPGEASVWYYLRAATKDIVKEMQNRLQKIAQGAAMMTETEVTWEILASPYETFPNEILNDLLYDNMLQLNELIYTEEEKSFAKDLAGTLNTKNMIENEVEELLPTNCLNNKSLIGTTFGASTDVGDVCWIKPVGQIMTTCAPVGVQFHTWQATASFGSSIGIKGMHYAAKTMALTAYDLLLNKDNVLEKAKAEFNASTKGKQYVPGIPKETHPHVQ